MSNRLHPPTAQRIPRVRRVHGETFRDDYTWLQDPKDPAVRKYIDAENAYADAIMKATSTLQQRLFSEIKRRMIEDDMSVPVKRGEYLYYTRTKKGKQYPIHCRKKGTRGREEVILDENALAKGSTFFALGALEVSRDHTKLAYSIDTKGDERFTLYVKDLTTGKLYDERLPSADGVAWSSDSTHIFYAKESHPYPPRIVMRHRLGTPISDDAVAYEERDPQWTVSISETADRQYILFSAGNFDTSECWYIPASDPHARPQRIAGRTPRVRYSVEHSGEYFYMLTNRAAVNFKIVRAHHPEDAWEQWLEHSTDRAITGFYAFRDFIGVSLREKGSEELYVTRSDARRLRRIPLPEPAHAISVNTGLEYDSPVLQFQYQSFITPRSVFDFDPARRSLTLRKRQRVPGWDPSPYAVRREWALSDGVRVPISIVYPKSARAEGPMPLLLDFYGSYGFTNDPFFSISRLSLLKRGWAVAIAHPRGGGEMGWQWHKAAVRTTKHRTYRDVIAAAEHLLTRHYTSKDLLFLSGGSAGGMTLGAVLNMRPDIARGAVCYVPDADVVTSSLDTSLGGTLLHYDELGDPRKIREFRYLRRWSPYENVQAAEYPSILVRASMHDIRTPYWEAAKWVARLRERTTSRGPLMLKIENHAGHGGKSGRYEWIRERAYDYAYLLTTLTQKDRR